MEGGQIKNWSILGIVLEICIILTACSLKTSDKDNSKLVNSENR